MEMFSKRFPKLIKEVFDRNDLQILATIPNKVPGGPLNALLETLKKNPHCVVKEVSKENRDGLFETLCSDLE